MVVGTKYQLGAVVGFRANADAPGGIVVAITEWADGHHEYTVSMAGRRVLATEPEIAPVYEADGTTPAALEPGGEMYWGWRDDDGDDDA